MWVYPPDGHKTDAKTIFILGSAKESAQCNGVKLNLINGNFCELVELELGENIIELELDSRRESRTVIGVQAATDPAIAYAYPYEVIQKSTNKLSSLRSIIVGKSDYKLYGAAAQRIERVTETHAKIFLIAPETVDKVAQADTAAAKTFQDLDWIHYTDLDSELIIEPNADGTLDLYSHELRGTGNSFPKCLIERPTKELVLCLDPGHGGSQAGTQSPKGIYEKDLNLSLALKLANKLRANGIKVILTRETDIDLSLADRVKAAQGADLFISLHHNALPDGRDLRLERGLSVHYYHARDRELARGLLKAMLKTTGLPLHGLFRQNLHVLRENTQVPAILIECGFLIHPEESEIISSEAFQDLFAESLNAVIIS